MNSELKKRIATALVGALVLLLIIIYGGRLGIFAISTIVSVGMVNEFAQITFSLKDRWVKRYLVLGLAGFVALGSLLAPRTDFELLIICFSTLFIYFLVSARHHEEIDFSEHFKELMFAFFGLLYLSFIPVYLQKIHEMPDGVNWTIFFLFIVWANDIGAYFAGKKFGRTKLYEKISPKKTVEGAIGGLASGVLIALLYKVVIFRGAAFISTVIFLPLVVGFFAQVGDLCESFLKRAFGTKDSGSILPGHGGFLDRFDGVVFSLPVMYAFIRILG